MSYDVLVVVVAAWGYEILMCSYMHNIHLF